MENDIYFLNDYDFLIKKIHSEKKNKDYYALVLRIDGYDIILCFLYNSIADSIIHH